MTEQTRHGTRPSKISGAMIWAIVGSVGTVAGVVVAVLAWLLPQPPVTLGESPDGVSPPADGDRTFARPKDTDGAGEPTGIASTQLSHAHRECSTGDLVDGGRTLEIDVAGDEPGSGTATMTGFSCVLDFLEAPRSVVARMESTRALDGMQSGTWGAFEASWTYHPDRGANVIITLR